MLQRLLCLTFILIWLSQSLGETLERDYSMDRPLLCPMHMKNYSNWFECNGPCEDVSLIPSIAETCDYCVCGICNKVWWTRFADEDGQDADFFWNCLCKWAEPERGWDEDMDSWEYCAHPIVYQGYFDRNFRTYSDLLNDHLAYHKENLECLCTWPERSIQAAAISNRAYRLIRNILEHTQLSVLVDDSTEQGQFLRITPRSCRNAHGLTINSLRGLSQGLWALVEHPRTVSKEFLQAMNDLVYFLRDEANPGMLLDVIPELRILVNQWSELNPYQKGEQFGFIIGKYGVDIFAGAGSIKLIHKFRKLKRANTLLTLESCEVSPELTKLVLMQASQREKLRIQTVRSRPLKIEWDKQNKHVIGSKFYDARKSVLTHKDPQTLVQRFAGTGRPANPCHPGQSGYTELVDFGEIIGYDVRASDVPVKFGTIHYSEKGVHIVPHLPKKLRPQ